MRRLGFKGFRERDGMLRGCDQLFVVSASTVTAPVASQVCFTERENVATGGDKRKIVYTVYLHAHDFSLGGALSRKLTLQAHRTVSEA